MVVSDQVSTPKILWDKAKNKIKWDEFNEKSLCSYWDLWFLLLYLEQKSEHSLRPGLFWRCVRLQYWGFDFNGEFWNSEVAKYRFARITVYDKQMRYVNISKRNIIVQDN